MESKCSAVAQSHKSLAYKAKPRYTFDCEGLMNFDVSPYWHISDSATLCKCSAPLRRTSMRVELDVILGDQMSKRCGAHRGR